MEIKDILQNGFMKSVIGIKFKHLLFIPIKENVKRGYFRKKQMKNWDKEKYNLRSNIESGFSAIKRKYGGNIKAKKIQGIRTEIMCKGIAHNLRLN